MTPVVWHRVESQQGEAEKLGVSAFSDMQTPQSKLPSHLHPRLGRLLEILSLGPRPGSIKGESALKQVASCLTGT